MHPLEILLLGLIVCFPLIDWVNEKYKSQNKSVEYLKTAFFLWIPTLLLAWLYHSGRLSLSGFNFAVEADWRNLLSIGIVTVGLVYLVLMVRAIHTSEETRQQVAEKFESFAFFTPTTRSEFLLFTLLVSVSAGICEELIFRAYLFTFIDGYLGMAAAIALSSILFGCWHFYLGWTEVVKTAVLGAVFCGIYIFTGNIVVPIIAHIFIDVYSGALSYYSLRKQGTVA